MSHACLYRSQLVRINSGIRVYHKHWRKNICCVSSNSVTNTVQKHSFFYSVVQLKMHSILSSKSGVCILILQRFCSSKIEKQRKVIEYLSVLDGPSSHGTDSVPEPVSLQFVPACSPIKQEDIDTLQEFVRNSKRLLVMTGAGISTESGIPDYRSEGVGLYARSSNRPVQYIDFVKHAHIRQRYWARNYVGWPKFGYFLPNSSHKTLSRWEDMGKLHWLVTQNVDALHYKAGSKKVTELHGSAHRVMCLGCDFKMTRQEMQELIRTHNPDWSAHSEEMAPDADVQLSQEQIEGFKVPPCPSCGGNLKPEITFFGDNVAKPTVEFVRRRVEECDALLMAGTSLQVYSGYRFAAAAKEQCKPIAILNIGPTRADKLADVKIDAKCGDVLPKIRLAR